MATTTFKLTRRLRNELVREGHRFIREQGGAYDHEVGDHLAHFMLAHDGDRYGTDPFPAIEVSDYAYGLATFVMGGREYIESR